MAERNKVNDWIASVAPAISLKSDFSGPYTLNLDAKATALRNFENHREDQDNFTLGTDGSYGIPALGKDTRASA